MAGSRVMAALAVVTVLPSTRLYSWRTTGAAPVAATGVGKIHYLDLARQPL